MLPIDAILPEIREHLRTHNCLVLQASPGSGKTTRVPSGLLELPELSGKEIWVLEPRRLAAKWAARRVAQELGEDVGHTVGYQFRFESVGGRRTRLRFFTEGTLARKLLSAPELPGVGLVVLDEFHERHVAGDIVLGHLKRLQEKGSPIKILVMSATLDSDRLAAYLGGCRVISLHAHAHPVEISYLDKGMPSADLKDPRALAQAVRHGVRRLWESEPAIDSRGDMLVFLPGQADIRRAEELLQGLELPTDILSLHGEMERDAQDRVMQRSSQSRPRIILSTNVAESSLTIDGVRSVLDSGLHKQATRSDWSGITALRLRPVSRASATQRAGRAGRQGPGRCLRLYSKHDHDTRPPFDPPEVLRADLAPVILDLAALGVQDAQHFPWLDAPPTTSLLQGQELLLRLGAIRVDSTRVSLTETGRMLVGFSAHPRLARMIIEGGRLGCAEQAALLAALLAEEEIASTDAQESFERAWRSRRGGAVAQFEKQLLSQLSDIRMPLQARARSWEEAVSQVALAGFPDRVARYSGKDSWLVATGGSIEGQPHGELAVILSARETGGKTKVGSLWPLREDDLLGVEPSPLAERVEWRWDKARGKIIKHTSLRYFELVLREESLETFSTDSDRLEASRAYLRLALKLPEPDWSSFSHALRTSVAGGQEIEEKVSQVFYRAKLLESVSPALPQFPTPAECLGGITRTDEMIALNWEEALLSHWEPQERRRLDALCPTSISLKNGRRCPVHYEADRAPWIESRLQDFFGEKETPKILGGKLPLLVHLLAPNHRPIQITQDLAGFWSRVYPEVRRELSRNYPRHAWPEDPLTADPPPLKKAPPRSS